MRSKLNGLILYTLLVLAVYIIYSGILVANNYDTARNSFLNSIEIINARKQLIQIEQNSGKLKELYDLCLVNSTEVLDEEYGKNKYTKIFEHDYCQERARQSLGLPKDLKELRALANKPLPSAIVYNFKKDE
jgi:hypothetical protein